jgi:hypothetical protein
MRNDAMRNDAMCGERIAVMGRAAAPRQRLGALGFQEEGRLTHA